MDGLENFVDPNHPEVNTQAIEGLWMQAKRKLRYQSGTSRALFPSYLGRFSVAFQSQDAPIWAVFEIAEGQLSHLTVVVTELTVFLE